MYIVSFGMYIFIYIDIDDPIKTHHLPDCNTYCALNTRIDCIQISFMVANQQKHRQPANKQTNQPTDTALIHYRRAAACLTRALFVANDAHTDEQKTRANDENWMNNIEETD